MARALQIAGLIAGVIGLVVQFLITVPASLEAGRSLAGSVVFYFSFFTILTNIAAVLVHVSLLSPAGYAWLPIFAGSRVRAGVAVYATVLAQVWEPEGLFLLCDVLLHYVTPVLFVAWWLAAGANGKTRWSDIPYWMLYPIAYLFYALARGQVASEVPYPFLDVAANGGAAVALSVVAVLAAFLVLSILAVLADRGVSRFRTG